MRKSVLLFVAGFLVVLFQNCSQNVDFNAGEPISLSSSSGQPEGNQEPGATGDDSATPVPGSGDTSSPEAPLSSKLEQFKVTFGSESAPLDMIWVIDNSGSMSAEASLVRRNFDAFLTALNKSTNFRLLLVSAGSTSSTGVSIPASFDPATHKQIFHAVGSTDGPKILLEKLKTLPVDYLREGSKKIIVFVTDDNSAMASSSFLSSLLTQQKWSAQDVSISSFIGVSKAASPCIAREGTAYVEMAASTKGLNYDICAQDWSQHFNDLINTSVSKAVRRFSLEVAPKALIEVKVDGVVLAKDAYTLEGKVVTLADGVNLSENSSVSVSYEY